MSEPTLPPSDPEPASERTEHLSRFDSTPAAGLGSPTVELPSREVASTEHGLHVPHAAAECTHKIPALRNDAAVATMEAATVDLRPNELSIAVAPDGGHTTDFNVNEHQLSHAVTVDRDAAT